MNVRSPWHRHWLHGFRRCVAPLASTLILMTASLANAATADGLAPASDPFNWLEDVHSDRAMDWVRAENAKTAAVLEAPAEYPKLLADAQAIAGAEGRLPVPRFIAGEIFNFWQDSGHPRGLWRKTNLANYRQEAPQWATVLDLDALARTEGADWVWQDATCLRPVEERCLISLSDGGEDAVTIREFDLAKQNFVSDGFDLPKSKQSVAWIDEDRLLVARDWGAGTMTTAGYPFVVKLLQRGRPLSAAQEIFRGRPADTEIDAVGLDDNLGHSLVLILRHVSFFETEYYRLGPGGLTRLDLPPKSAIADLIANRLLIVLNQDWVVAGRRFAQGALVFVDLHAMIADPRHLQPVLVYAPGPREFLSEVSATGGSVVAILYRNVQGRAVAFVPTPDGGWSQRLLAAPERASMHIVATDLRSQQAVLSESGFLSPPSLWLAGAAEQPLTELKALPAQFDAAGLVVEQRTAQSKDGTRIPYFLIHSAAMKLDGRNPTILKAYGGFQLSCTPYYLGVIGKLWLQRGGTFALANIRGGGEFGPAWHEAGLKTHRQRIYDDFSAVAEDLIARKITGPRNLGIQGASNGGLLMGVQFTQHPTLWHAVDIQVPLLDMLRFEQIDAGASWVGEYGSVANPSERAFLAGISPYQNLKVGVQYPEPFIWTATDDDRVGPQHARKFAAKLAALGVPYLFFEVAEGGHSFFDETECGVTEQAGIPQSAQITALEMSYFTRQLMH
jgi:prolyl oligopeptidase